MPPLFNNPVKTTQTIRMKRYTWLGYLQQDEHSAVVINRQDVVVTRLRRRDENGTWQHGFNTVQWEPY